MNIDHHSITTPTPAMGDEMATSNSLPPVHIWLITTGTISLISLLSLVGLMTVPLMKRSFYNHLLRFMVALAAGTLSADAIFHLIPHSLISHDHGDEMELHDEGNATSLEHDHEHEEEEYREHMIIVWKSCTIFLGFYLLYLFERLIQLLKQYRRNKKAGKISDILRARQNFIGQKLHSHAENGINLENSCSDSLFLLPSQALIDQISELDNKEFHGSLAAFQDLLLVYSNKGYSTNNSSEDPATQPSTGYRKENGRVVFYEEQPLDETSTSTSHSDESQPTPLVVITGNGVTKEEEDKTTESTSGEDAVLEEAHGHSHGAEGDSIATIAWMIIISDGVHNFSDGLAIGAAFSASLVAGISTSIAVLCHELPHEFGDFAVLLRAGMSIKMAAFYNLLSASVALIGGLLGCAIGNMGESTQWIFAAIGGMFLYISLCDLLPEMHRSDGETKDSPLKQLLYQNCGFIMGVIAMLLIAIYEPNLNELFSQIHLDFDTE